MSLFEENYGRLLIFIKIIMSFFFLSNSVYGFISGIVLGRSQSKYWGGWIYKDKEPFYYWIYTIGHFIVGIILLLTCLS